MKRFILSIITLFLMLGLIYSLSLKKVQAQSCDMSSLPGPGNPCTVCEPDNNLRTCIVDYGQSYCPYPLIPDPWFCNNYDWGGCPNINVARGECIECRIEGRECFETGVQSTCCEGLICETDDSGYQVCQVQYGCRTANQVCTGPATPGNCCSGLYCHESQSVCVTCHTDGVECVSAEGSARQGSCCDGLTCDYWDEVGVLTCGAPRNIVGFWCVDTITGCQQCNDTDINSECNPPEYCIEGLHDLCTGGFANELEASTACDNACNGTSPVRYSCIENECREAGNGEYDTWDCDGNCAAGPIYFPPPPPQEVFCVTTDPDVRTDDSASGRVATAIGCIPVRDLRDFVLFLLPWGIGIAGGIAFILFVFASIIILFSSGNPQQIQAGKELLTATVTGLLLIVFGTLILEFIGVNILNIPGF